MCWGRGMNEGAIGSKSWCAGLSLSKSVLPFRMTLKNLGPVSRTWKGPS